jgi:hypothetical protein
VGEDGAEVLIPTVSDDGRLLSNAEAIALYQQTGRHLGKFRDIPSASQFAEKLHESEAQKLKPMPSHALTLGQLSGLGR